MPTVYLVLIVLAVSTHSFAEQTVPADEPVVETQPIIVIGQTPGDELSQDLVIPVKSGSTDNGVSSSGGIARILGHALAVPIQVSTTPGGLSQIRGLGRSAEDISVQTLGIPLNSPQGGGFDLSQFPQFIWSDYQFQLTPSPAGFDPRGVSGALSLAPWTSRALFSNDQGRITGLYSTSDLQQLSAGVSHRWDKTSGAAILGGYSQGLEKGPSGSLSTEYRLGSVEIAAHLLATDLSVKVPGALNFPTPLATQNTQRWIPVVQVNVPFGSETQLKTAFFYDSANIRFVDDDVMHMTNYHSHATQLGIENALLTGAWRFGISVRSVNYGMVDEYGFGNFTAPQESILNLQASRLIETNGIILDPSIQMTAVERQGTRPAASVGMKYGQDKHTLFARLSYSNRFPSLVDRYFSSGSYQGNAGLPIETDYTLLGGWSLKNKLIENTVEVYGQFREHSRLDQPTTVIDGGSARIFGVMDNIALNPLSWLEISNNATLMNTWLQSTNSSFPYSPGFLNALIVTLRDRPENPYWMLSSSARYSSSVLASSSNSSLKGYWYFDFAARVRINKQTLIALTVDNIIDSQFQTIENYPGPRRSFSVSLISSF